MQKNSLPKNLGELKKSKWKSRSVKEELKENLISKIKKKEKHLFPGIVGYEDTVEKNIINAILAKHNFILLGLRGQAKTKIIRSLVHLLDEKTPVIRGSLLNEDPFNPISPFAKKLIEKKKDDTPIQWISRQDRFKEKLATPDVSISDLIGDIDPIKAAREKLDISNEEVIHWGIIPRSNRGIFAINELPDLQARIQVGLFNILEENDIQIRGFPLRLPLDILLVFSANPEDYTNRGRIITPLKDRIASEIITHYPTSLEMAKAITLSQVVIPQNIVISQVIFDLIEMITLTCRENEHVDKMSGVSQRLSIAILELIIANAERRRTLLKNKKEKVRVLDLYTSVTAITGKIELVEDISVEETKNLAVHLINKAITKKFNEIFPPLEEKKKSPNEFVSEEENFKGSEGIYGLILEYFKQGNELQLNDDLTDNKYYQELEKIPQLKKIVKENMGEADDYFACLEILLEGLYGNQVINRKLVEGQVKFFDAYSNMFREK